MLFVTYTHPNEHIRLVESVNNAKTKREHDLADAHLYGWRQGVKATGGDVDVCGADMFYLNQGIERPMCCGVWLDWEPAANAPESTRRVADAITRGE